MSQEEVWFRVIQLTESAKEYLRQVGKPNVSLSVKGGGCSVSI